MYGEEADLCHRARQLGARPIVTPHATIIHYGGASTVSTSKQQLLLLKGKATLLRRHWRPGRRRLRAGPLFAGHPNTLVGLLACVTAGRPTGFKSYHRQMENDVAAAEGMDRWLRSCQQFIIFPRARTLRVPYRRDLLGEADLAP